MKKTYILTVIVLMIFASCKKESENKEPVPAPQNLVNEDENNSFSSNYFTIYAADFGGGTYAEYTVDFISQEIYEYGVAVAYVQDTFGYWNTIPSQWHEITDFGFFYGPNANGVNVGVVGFSASGGITADYPVTIVTMKRSDYEYLENHNLLNDYNQVVKYLSK